MQLLPSSTRVTTILSFVLIIVIAPVFSWAEDLKPEDVVSKHLDAIGPAQLRSGLKSRVVQGGATYRVLVGGSGAVDGKFVFASEGPKSNFLFKINANGFLGEQFICDGNKTSVAGTYPDKRRSEFGTFIFTQDIVLRENLLGGVWSSGWPLLDVEGRGAKLHYEGMKKVDGRELIALRYQPRKRTDLDIFLYFDPQTYQHVMSVYELRITTGLGGGEAAQSGKQQTRYRIEERFSEFQAKDGLTLPTHYDLQFTLELGNGFTKLVEWEVRAFNIMNNESIDERSFQPK
jgi:hypothetical protein